MKIWRTTRIAGLVLMFSSIFWGSASAWDQTTHENILVFDGEGEVVSSYNLPNWSVDVGSGLATHEEWKPGSPPTFSGSAATTAVSYQTGVQTVIPNVINGSDPKPAPGIPSVSLYSFDEALFSSVTPTGPGLSVSPSPAVAYDHTIAVELRAVAQPGAHPTAQVAVEIYDSNTDKWVRYGQQKTVYVYTNTTIQARSVLYTRYLTQYSPEYTYNYTVTHPKNWNRDSDNDGYPDAWEVAKGFDPLGSERDKVAQDTDGDGFNDIDEILRGTNPDNGADKPVDTDGDGWSDWDEWLRETNAGDPNVKPAATRLYEVEVELSGTAYKSTAPAPAGLMSNAHIAIENLLRVPLYAGRADIFGAYGSIHIPMGSEAFLRASDPSQPGLVVKRYLGSIADPRPQDMGTITWRTPQEWENAWVAYLRRTLVQTVSGVDVRPSHLPQIALIERGLEILSNTSDEAWLSFGTFGHPPEPGVVADLAKRLGGSRDRSYSEAGTLLPTRSINTYAADLEMALAAGCLPIDLEIADIYSNLAGDNSTEEMSSMLLKGVPGTYLAGILLDYSFTSLANESGGICAALNPNGDMDGDGLLNNLEAPTPLDPLGSSSPFHADSDGDGVPDRLDNCGWVTNADQHDWDGDGEGDACDTDDDNDGLQDGVELTYASNPYNPDTNENGIGDAQQWRDKTFPGTLVYFTDYQSPANLSSQVLQGVRAFGATVTFSTADNCSLGRTTYPTPTTWSLTVIFAPSDTVCSVQATANVDGYLGYASLVLQTDFDDPIVTITSPSEGTVYGDNDPLLNFTVNEPVSSVTVSLDATITGAGDGDRLGPLSEGEHILLIETEDFVGNRGYSQVAFSIDANNPPVADAGPNQDVEPGNLVVLSAANSFDFDDAVLRYAWTQTGGTTVSLADPTAPTTTFTAPAFIVGGEALEFQLMVTDDSEETGTDACLINVTSDNLPPVADAGAGQDVTEGFVFTLNGGGSFDADSSAISYSWNQLTGPSVVLSDPTIASPTCTAPGLASSDSVTLVFELRVTDTEGLLAVDRTLVNVIRTNDSPVANAGADQVTVFGAGVVLDGTASSDPDGTIVQHWKQVKGEPVSLSSPLSPQPAFVAPIQGNQGHTMTFRLTVTDDGGLLDQDSATVTFYLIDYDRDGDIDGYDLSRMAAESTLTAEQIRLFIATFGKP